MKLPNFILIGVQKAGTSAVAKSLGEHPEIFMSPMKEPGFFDFYGLHPNFCGPKDKEAYQYSKIHLQEYCQLFHSVTNEIAIGEATTWYLQSEKAPFTIKRHIPNAKLIVILRNPVDRAYSAFMHATRDNREPLQDFKEAFNLESIRVTQNWGYMWRYKSMGLYSMALKRYLSVFDKNQIKIFLYEDLCNQPQIIYRDIFNFLGVNNDFVPYYDARYNISGVPKSRVLDDVVRGKSKFKRLFKYIPKTIKKPIANYLRIKNMSKINLSIETRKELIKFFEEDILEVQELINRDLSQWLT